ncbi:MAG: c-type cytochrome [Proteobacteria bacterium]|nr:c-type cytochrome [Pseudomonadota bacterium]
MQKHKIKRVALAATLLTTAAIAYATTGVLASFEAGEDRPGGNAATADDHGRNAFSLSADALSEKDKTSFVIGNSFFKKAWVAAPASTTARDGLGPHFIARSCGACHSQDGRGTPPDFNNGIQDDQPLSLLLRLSIPGDKLDPNYGGQFNNDAIDNVKPEGKVQISYKEIPGHFADGEKYSLRAPTYTLSDLAYGPTHPQLMMSPRVAPQMIGLGLLEAISEKNILANAARQKAEGLGIKGMPNYVADAYAGKTMLGRFGWKANVASIAHQSAGAFNGDIGITSKHFPKEECMPAQKDCLQAPHGGKPEIDSKTLDKVILYSRTLAVPSRRDPQDAAVLRGKQVFKESNCVSCHTPSYTTANFKAVPVLSGQKIWPYTDLLLHDMGKGLADGRPDGLANGNQWKTPPLWGLGLVPAVNNHSNYLHDGRARNLMEAVLWHGGEAENAKQTVLKLSKTDRDNLLKFLQSL